MTSEAFLQLADLLPEPALLIRGDGRILAANRAAAECWSLASKEIQGRMLAHMVTEPPEETAHYLCACSRSRKMVLGSLTLSIKPAQTMACRAEGAVARPRTEDADAMVLLRLVPKASAAGEFLALNLRINELSKEIHRRKEAEAVIRRQDHDLRESEGQHRLLAEVSAALVGSLHYQSILQQVADVAVPRLGDYCYIDVMAADDELERVAWTHVDPANAGLKDTARTFAPPMEAVNHPVIKALKTGQPVLVPEVDENLLREVAMNAEHLEFLEKMKPHSVMTVPMLVGERRLGALTFCFSVSGRRHTTEDLRIAQEIARRAALTVENAKLFSQLREADRRKDEFLAVLAHELRNPLAPLANALAILRRTDISGQVAQMRDMMERQVKQMVRLVDDLLDVSRITRGRIDLRKEKLDLAEVIDSAVEISRPAIEAGQHELTIIPAAQPIFVEGDRTRLAQVVSNLLTNSAKYTPPRGHVWLSAESQGRDAIIRVRDNGIGIPAEMLPEIFEMFTQVDRNLGKSKGGLGIGLTLVRSLVELHGGSIKARSTGPGMGSEFIVRLPLAAVPKKSMNAGQLPAGSSSIVESSPRRRILVVDDNVDSADSLAMMLKLSGNEVCTAYDGRTALEAAAVFVPDLVLLDIGLPGMDGYELARKLRQMPTVKGALLIAQTGWGQEEDRRRSDQAGFDHHFTKPVDVEALQKLLTAVRTANR